MRGEDLFRFGDVKREFGFHPAAPDNLTALTARQIDEFNLAGYLSPCHLYTSEAADDLL